MGERWHTQLYGASHEDLKWLRQPDEWAAFFRRLIIDTAGEKERIALEHVMAGWFSDRETIDFFVRLEKTASVQSEELLCAQLYLRQHKLTYDTEKTRASITALSSSESGRKMLLAYADELRDPVFVPWLIEIVEPAKGKVEVGNAQWILEEITFCREISGRSSWSRWFEQHKNESRGQWIAAAMAEFTRTAKGNPPAAHAILREAVYRWKDRDTLPYMKRLIGQPELASDLVGWINLSYHEYWREDLRAVAAEVIKVNRAALAPWTVGLLEGLDFIPHMQFEWEDYVALSNLRM